MIKHKIINGDNARIIFETSIMPNFIKNLGNTDDIQILGKIPRIFIKKVETLLPLEKRKKLKIKCLILTNLYIKHPTQNNLISCFMIKSDSLKYKIILINYSAIIINKDNVEEVIYHELLHVKGFNEKDAMENTDKKFGEQNEMYSI
jgi:hypothetical protein